MKIVVGVDGSGTSKAAAHEAAALAVRLGADLHLVTGIRRNHVTKVASGADHWIVTDSDKACEKLQAFAAELPEGLEVTVAALAAPAAKAIVREADRVGADLIIVGNKRMQGATRVLGSIGAEVLHHAHCNVLIAKTT